MLSTCAPLLALLALCAATSALPVLLRDPLPVIPEDAQRQGVAVSDLHAAETTGHGSAVDPREGIPAGDHATSASERDLEVSETGHGGGGDAEGYLDMGAYSGKYGAFGWYADFPVGGYH